MNIYQVNSYINITIYDFILVPLLFILFIYFGKASKSYKNMPEEMQKAYIKGLYIKLFATLAFCIIHIFFYGGDTHMYFGEMLRLKEIAFQDIGGYLKILWKGYNSETYHYFDNGTGHPMGSMKGDVKTYFVPRILSPISFIGFNSFIVTSLLISRIVYMGIWRLFKVFYQEFPDKIKIIKWAILFTPSVLFWGSGILKDSICLAAIGFFTYAFYQALLQRKPSLSNIITLIASTFVIISIKPYIFVAILPGSLLWLSFGTIKKIKSIFIKILAFPLIILFSYLLFTFIFSSFDSQLGQYGSINTMLYKAKVTKDDHTRSAAYSENYYDVGELDGTLGGTLSKAPQSIVAGLYRPFIWEARNPFILMSGLENFVLLLITFWMFFKTGFFKIFKTIFNTPLLFFCLFFSIFFAFSVGLATANFGALVRLRTPMLPFFVYLLLHLNSLGKEKKEDLFIEKGIVVK